MGLNPFDGWTEAELLAKRREIQDELSDGGAIIQSSAGDVSATRQTQAGSMHRLNMIQRALYLLNPDRYPLSSIGKTRSVAVMGQGL